MSALPESSPAATAPLPSVAGSHWSLWRRQVAAILRLERTKSFLGRRAILLYLLALMPVMVMVAYAVGGVIFGAEGPLEQATQIFAWIYQIFLLRFVVFFGCVWAFTNLFRGEMLDQSLHYYFLAPVKRQVLVVGKYLAALITTVVLFGGATAICYLLMYVPFGGQAMSQHFLSGPGLGQLFAYLGVTVLACLGYGALFLLIGLFFRNPILPAFAILLWEGINFLLPQLLKKLSVVHYLKSLSPVPLSEGPFALVAEPPPAIVSVGGLVLLTAVILFLAGLRIRRMEIDYGGD